MREVIGYSRDFLTGKVTTAKKNKPSNSPMRGLTKIELFNAKTGDKEQEVCCENKIEDDDIYRQMFRDFFIHRFISSGNVISGTPFRMIKLYDEIKSGSEQVVDFMFNHGGTYDCMGYCNLFSPYVGADFKRGSYDQQASRLDVNFTTGEITIKFVFDFSIYAANGTIGMIKWYGTLGDQSISSMLSRVPRTITNFNSSSSFFGGSINEVFEAYYPPEPYASFGIDISISKWNESKYALLRASSSSGGFRAYIVDLQSKTIVYDSNEDGISGASISRVKASKGKNYYAIWGTLSASNYTVNFILFNTQTGQISKYLISTVNDGEGGTTWQNIFFNFEDEWIDDNGILKGHSTVGGVWITWSFHPATATLSKDNGEFLNKYRGAFTNPNTKPLVQMGNGLIAVDFYIFRTNDDRVISDSASAFDSYRNISLGSSMDSLSHMQRFTNPLEVHFLKGRMPRYSAVNYLPTPITKTALQTMRLTYTFVIDASRMLR
jgi:hypothetical protein